MTQQPRIQKGVNVTLRMSERHNRLLNDIAKSMKIPKYRAVEVITMFYAVYLASEQDPEMKDALARYGQG